MPRGKKNGNESTATVGFEAKLWAAADELRNNMDAAEYKHVVLGLIFLKYISDAFEEKHAELEGQTSRRGRPGGPGRVPRRQHLLGAEGGALGSICKANAPQPTIGKIVDDAMVAIERDNPSAQGRAAQGLRPAAARQAAARPTDRPGRQHRPGRARRTASKDILGRVYEYFLSQFASAEGKKGGQFYTPRRVVRVLVEMLAPYKGRVYDPCCGSGGMFVQSEKFIEAHGGRVGDIVDLRAGVEPHHLAAGQDEPRHPRHRRADLAAHADSFHRDLHPDLKADYVLANPPFNDSDWRGDLLRDDKRWKYGVPPSRQRQLRLGAALHLTIWRRPAWRASSWPTARMSSNQSGEGEIRKAIIEADLVDCMVALPGQLFYSTQIPVCLWFLARDKRNGRFRDRRGETLFIDARKMGTLIDRVHRELTEEDDRRSIAGDLPRLARR